jgi:hypothetical protein
MDGRKQKAEKMLTPPENVRDNLAVLSEIAMRTNTTVEADWQKAIMKRKSSVALN